MSDVVAEIGRRQANGDYTHLYACAYEINERLCRFEQKLLPDGRNVFDLASLTKALVIAPLMANELLPGSHDLGSSLGEWLGTYSKCFHPSLRSLTLQELLEHRSGLPAWSNLWIEALQHTDQGARRAKIIDKLNYVAEVSNFEKTHLYSDLGFILLGLSLEEKHQSTLIELFNQFCLGALRQREPGLRYGREIQDRSFVVPTSYCALRERELVAEVHDENAAVLEERGAGHAGLFGSGEALTNYLAHLLSSAPGQWLWGEVQKGASKRLDEHVFGWQKRLIGKRLVFGHLGFTGTAFWVDSDGSKVLVLLTNRVISGRRAGWMSLFRRSVFEHLLAH